MKGLVSFTLSMLVPVNAPPGMSHSPLLRHKVGPGFLHWRSSCLCIWPSIYVCVWQLPLLKIPPIVNTRCAGGCSVWGGGGDLTLYVQCHACACSYVVHIN